MSQNYQRYLPRYFCHLFNPNYVILCVDTVKKKNLLLVYNDTKKEVVAEIAAAAGSASVTTDMWTSCANRGITVTNISSTKIGSLGISYWQHKL